MTPKFLLSLFCFLCFQTIFAQQWVQKADPPNSFDPRNHPVTFTLDGFGYVATGNNPANIPLDDFYKYDPINDSWEQLPDFPGQARGYSYGVAAENGKAYMGFGLNNNTLLKDFWEYDPATEEWTQLASCPCVARFHPTMVQAAGKIYVGQGSGGAGDLKDFWAYDIASDTWAQKGDLPGPGRHHPFYFDINGKVYTGFGHSGQTIFRDFYVFNPNTNGWTQLNDFPGEARVAGTQFSYNGKGYVLSGDGDNHGHMPTGEMWEYDAAMDQWTQLTPHPGSSRWAPGCFVVDDMLFFVNGQVNGDDLADIWAFDFGDPTDVETPTIEKIEIFPNPVSDLLTVNSDASYEAFEIYDSMGKLVAQRNWESNQINVSTLNSGAYMIQMKRGDVVEIGKFVIVK